MFVVIVDVTVRPDGVELFKEAIFTQAANSLEKESGCLGFDVLQNPDEPTRFMLYESYTDAPTFHDVHRNTEHFAQYAAATEPLVVDKQFRTMSLIWPDA